MKANRYLMFSMLTMVIGIQALPASSLEIDRKAYQAEYKLTGSYGTSQHLMAFDGNGHGRSEMSRNGSKNISIIDYQQRKVMVLMPGMKSAMTIPLTDDQLSSMGAISDKMKARARSLGLKTILGHPCTGTKYSLEGGVEEEIWNGNDIGGVRVYSKVVAPGAGVSEATLVKFDPSPPPAKLFTIPAGYSVN
ncbi:MAG: DUF4412 domain-containing protein [Candidatus Obscuribacterales bacterium]|nr:DUF4412 domain-containing protein [Candidatus Obscuribacterales bacterium]